MQQTVRVTAACVRCQAVRGGASARFKSHLSALIGDRGQICDLTDDRFSDASGGQADGGPRLCPVSLASRHVIVSRRSICCYGALLLCFLRCNVASQLLDTVAPMYCALVLLAGVTYFRC